MPYPRAFFASSAVTSGASIFDGKMDLKIERSGITL